MDRKCLNTVAFRYSCDANAVLVVAVPSGACFQCDRHSDRPYHAVQNSCNQLLVLQQGGSCQTIADFFCGAAHVDIDDLRAGIHVAALRLGHHRGIEAGDLHDTRAGLARMVHAPARFRRVPQPHIGAEHLRRGKSCAKTPAENAKGTVGNACHGRKQDDGRQFVRADLHGTWDRGLHRPACGATSLAQETFRSTPRRHTSISNPSAFLPGSKIAKVASTRSPGASSFAVGLPRYSAGSKSRLPMFLPKRSASITRNKG